MGSALVDGWRASALDVSQLLIVETNQDAQKTFAADLACVTNARDIPATFTPDIILLAVKPQVLEEAIKDYRTYSDSSLFISIAAGKTLGWFEKHLSASASVVRVMPNTPSMIGRGMSVLIANNYVDDHEKHWAQALCAAVGKILWLSDESLMDTVTAISGSGPAYVFLFMESMISAAVSMGLTESDARLLVEETIIGSGLLSAASTDTLATLRRNVTSPGGTTEAALSRLLENDALRTLMTQAILAAHARSRELSS